MSTWTTRTLGTGVGQRTRALFLGLQWTLPAALSSRLLCGVATLFAARVMGPAGYGEASLALAASLWIQVPLFLGIPTATMHYVPKAPENEKSAWIHAAMALLAIFGILTLGGGYLFAPTWAHLQGITTHIFMWALIWSGGYALYTAGTCLVIAEEKFRRRAELEVVFAFLFAGALWLMTKLGKLQASHYIFCFGIAYGLAGLLGLGSRSKLSSASIKATHAAHALLSYGLIAAFGNVANALLYSSGRLVANHHLSLSEVGIVAAYQGGSIQMASFLVSIAVQVFFPLASRTPDKKVLFKKMNRVLLVGAPVSAVGFSLLQGLYFLVLGKRYPLDAFTLSIYSLAAVLSSIYAILSWFLAALGRRGLIASTLIGLLIGGINIAACLIFIPIWKVAGAGMASALAAGAGMAICYLPQVRHLSSEPSTLIGIS